MRLPSSWCNYLLINMGQQIGWVFNHLDRMAQLKYPDYSGTEAPIHADLMLANSHVFKTSS